MIVKLSVIFAKVRLKLYYTDGVEWNPRHRISACPLPHGRCIDDVTKMFEELILHSFFAAAAEFCVC